MATITFYGAAQEVTGSCHLLESTALGKVLLDCGMHQGGEATRRIKKDNFDFDPTGIDAIVLSHAHLDHSGLLPKLVNRGFDGPIYCTAATRDLLRILLNDAWHLYERDLERENVHLARRGRRPLAPEYVEKDVEKVLRLCRVQTYRKPVGLGQGASVTFHDAGHILGSAIVQIDFTEQGTPKKFLFSGDLGKRDCILMNDPAELTEADVVVMESTYGDRNHRSEEDTINELISILDYTWKRGGNILIPSFAVGRAQELLFYLGRLHHEGILNNWKVFLDSPMAIEVTRVYDNWLHIMDHDDIKQLNDANRSSLAEFLPALNLCVTPEESMAINKIKSGAIIIAGSGMCTGGRIRHHIKHRIWDPSNTMVIVGFQAQGTLGRLLVDGVKKIKLFGEHLAVKANIETLGGFSAHAGQTGLIDWISRFTQAREYVLVHGEPMAMQTLANKLRKDKNINCLMPLQGDRLEF